MEEIHLVTTRTNGLREMFLEQAQYFQKAMSLQMFLMLPTRC